MLVSSYWLKTVLFWNGVQGKLQKGWLETTMRYDSMCKVYDQLTMSINNYTRWPEAPPDDEALGVTYQAYR